MSEYIVEVTGQMPDAIYERELTEIVRCRNCKRYNEQEPGGKIGTCNLGLEDLDLLSIVEPDGFCKWAKRRDE